MKKLIIIALVSVVLGMPNSTLAHSDRSHVNPRVSMHQLQQTIAQEKERQRKELAERSGDYALLEAIKKQLEINKQQLEEAKKLYGSITSNQKTTSIYQDSDSFFLKNPQFIYKRDKESEINQVATFIKNIRDKENYPHNISTREARDSINERIKYAALVDKAVSLRVFEETKNRFSQIEKMLKDIDTMNDLKSIADLQAQIKGKLAMIQNEATKLQMVAHLRNAEQELISQLKRKRSATIFKSKNTQMPNIQYAKATQ
ncbi:P-type DNA transfer protein VirB5 [Bartonella quintana]|uniref:type IV secretion system protein n=1 Tax=Bartonella quintana TaxID=803 RepID=UPI0013160857|nr:type IV secretion system protein [Bartonella quintana]BBL53951.1 P-type DNA transfer protein VirB5 [Bartonella quintana]